MKHAIPTLIGLPWDCKSSFLRGCAQGPAAIRQELFSPAGNMWSENLSDLGLPENLSDAGDLSLPDNDDALAMIEAGIVSVIQNGGAPLALGGDHAVSYPILRAVGPRYPGLTILHIDAHPDLYDNFEGDRYSHACPFARIMEEKLAAQLIQVGIRTMNGHQRGQAERLGVQVIDMRAWLKGARPELNAPVYVSIDFDGIDPAFAPGVSHREPGGLSVRDVIAVIQSLPRPLVGADLVEYNPSRDIQDITARVAGKLLKELAAGILGSS
jgi:agmatinase